MKRSIPIFATVSVLLFSLVVQPTVKPEEADAVTASDWKAGYIIDDAKFTSSSAMSVSQIQSWLNNRLKNCDPNGVQTSELSGGVDYNGDGRITRAEYGRSKGNPAPFTCLNNYYEVPKTTPAPGVPASNYGGASIPSGAKSAAQLIYDAGRAYGISPKVLLVKLGTESAGPLTSDTWPFKSQYTYAMGAVCPDSGPGGSANCNENYAGFSMQMREAAKLLRWYLDNMNESWWPYKKPYTSNYILWNVVERGCGGSNVYIKSKATAALYTYTPYQPNAAALNNMYGTGDNCSAYGNRNFWRVYNDWFGPTTSAITSYLSTCSGQKYIIEVGQNRKRLVPDAVLNSWGFSADSFAYATYGCDLPTYDLELSSLVRSRSTGNVYYIDSGKAYKVHNQKHADAWGLGSIDRLPQFNGSTLLAYLTKIDHSGLSLVATSDNQSVSTYYLIVDGKRFAISGTDSGENSVLRMITGDTRLPRNTLPVSFFQSLENAGTVGYHFTASGEPYVFDYYGIRKVTSTEMRGIISRDADAAAELGSEILTYYANRGTLGQSFERDDSFYVAQANQSLTKTNSKNVVNNISNDSPPKLTLLLTNKLKGDSSGSATANELGGNMRLIECEGNFYIIERYVRIKRQIAPSFFADWNLEDNHFFTGDRGCAYPTYSLDQEQLIRSRNTGYVYYIDDGKAIRLTTQSQADSYGVSYSTLGDYSSVPQYDPKSILGQFTLIR